MSKFSNILKIVLEITLTRLYYEYLQKFSKFFSKVFVKFL